MSTCAFSIDQLMELAGLSVSQAGKSPENFGPHLRAFTWHCLDWNHLGLGNDMKHSP